MAADEMRRALLGIIPDSLYSCVNKEYLRNTERISGGFCGGISSLIQQANSTPTHLLETTVSAPTVPHIQYTVGSTVHHKPQ